MKELMVTISDKMEKEMQEMIDDKRLENLKTDADVIGVAFIVFKLVVDALVKGNKLAIVNKDNIIIKEVVLKV